MLLPVERHVQNPHIFIFFLEIMHEFEPGPEGESSRRKCNALRTFPRLFVFGCIMTLYSFLKFMCL